MKEDIGRTAADETHNDDDDNPDTRVFYDTLVDRIHDLTVLANQNFWLCLFWVDSKRNEKYFGISHYCTIALGSNVCLVVTATSIYWFLNFIQHYSNIHFISDTF